jgi:hypothetical protein
MNDYDDYFSGNEPDLVSKKVMKNFKIIIDNAQKPKIITEPILYNTCVSFYDDYIVPNIILLILLFIFVLFLLYRYYMKDIVDSYENIEKLDHFLARTNTAPKLEITLPSSTDLPIYNNYSNSCSKSKSKTYMDEQDDINFRPTFNPYYPVDEQTSYTNYLPNSLPLKKDGEYVNYYDVTNPKIRKNKYRMPYNRNNENVEYTGTFNTYYGAQDPVLPNAYGWIDDYNTTTERAVNYMTSENKRDIDLLAEIIHDNGGDYDSFNNGYY